MIRIRLAAAIAPVLLSIAPALAGGGGQNMLLIVNPNDENSLRMANAYVAARAIPESNILFIANPTAATSGYNLNQISYTAYNTAYRNAVPDAITNRGLQNIDYIGTIGTPHVVNGSPPDQNGVNTAIKYSFNYMLSMNTKFINGMTYPEADFRASELFKFTPPTVKTDGTANALPYTRGTNSAIHHDTTQWRMSGMVGYTGSFAITPQQYIDAYTRSAAADGTKPAGKVYFIETGDTLRTGTRKPYWKSVQDYMTAKGIAWEQLSGSQYEFNGMAINKPDVAGGIIGAANYAVPNGSTFLPGSYLDSLTSSGGSYGGSGQTKADKVIRFGAAGTAGTVTEPFAIADRFTQSSFYVFHHEGSTLGESFFMSVKRPDVDMFQGDLLSQAYADVPNVNMTGVSGSPVTGTMSIGASASLTSPSIATGVAKMQLYVDGKSQGVINAASGSFNLDTTALTDGRHEVRVVAYNNAAAESQGYTLDYITVNNKGQSVDVTGADELSATWNQQLAVPVLGVQGTGAAISKIELRSLGRVVGTLNGATGSITLDATKLAFGDNTIVPVALLAGGGEVRGESIVVNRDFRKLAGKTPVAAPWRTPGFKYEYFANAAGNTLALTNFNGPATITQQGTVLGFDPDSSTVSEQNMPDQFKANYAKLAVRVTASFNIAQEGEYTFWFGGGRWESLQLSVDGVVLQKHDLWTGSAYTSANTLTGIETSETMYLLAGEHDLQLLLANSNPAQIDTDSGMNMDFWYRDLAGDYQRLDSGMFYTAVPEPASLSVLGLGAMALLKRHKRKVLTSHG